MASGDQCPCRDTLVCDAGHWITSFRKVWIVVHVCALRLVGPARNKLLALAYGGGHRGEGSSQLTGVDTTCCAFEVLRDENGLGSGCVGHVNSNVEEFDGDHGKAACHEWQDKG